MSAGLVLFRREDERLVLFLAHPGGPFWRGRDEGAWTIPKDTKFTLNRLVAPPFWNVKPKESCAVPTVAPGALTAKSVLNCMVAAPARPNGRYR